MSSELIVNSTPVETRITLIENGVIQDLVIEREKDKGIVGNIFKGRVLRVLPGMQAAFVDVGLDRAAFLYVADVRDVSEADEEKFLLDDDTEPEPTARSEDEEGDPLTGVPEEAGAKPLPVVSASISRAERAEKEESRPQIQDLLKEGQEILVQVIKDPIGTKGARITTHVSLPGRNLVYMPTVGHIGVSRRIESEEERKRLKDIVTGNRPPEGGFIVRTACEGASAKNIKADMDFLVKLWKEVQRGYERRSGVGLVHGELDVELRAVRDLFTEDVDRLVVDNPKTHKKILKFVQQFMPKLKNQVELYAGDEPIFDHFGVELEISRALGRKVWLKSGGYIIIDEAEALVAIDVNTGRYVGKRNLEDTILKTNLEAVKEIAYQMRLRNCGGIIVLDFIDMEKEYNREKVLAALKEELAKDRAKTNVLTMSTLGLVEMTRKRTRESLVRALCEPCSYCDGKGFLKSKTTICYEIFREIQREARDNKAAVTQVHVNPELADWLYDEEREMIEQLEGDLGRRITIKVEESFHIEQFEVYSKT